MDKVNLIKQNNTADIDANDLFRTATYYTNRPSGRLGVDICLEKCGQDRCLEFGVTGNAWCFPTAFKFTGTEKK